MFASLIYTFFPIRQQRSTTRIYKTELNSMFKKISDVKLSDPNYKLVDVEQLQMFLRSNLTDARKYEKTVRDCDDFSYILMGDVTKWDPDLAFGIAWGYTSSGEYHAFNIFIDTQRQVQLVEPQTDDVFLVPDGWDIRFILM